MTEARVVAGIFARGGSKGISKKNLAKIDGITLLGLAIKSAQESKLISEIFVSTDCQEIAEEAIHHGASVPFMRPPHLASDKASELDAWKHAMNFFCNSEQVRPDIFLVVPTTAPLRLASDLDRCVEKLISGGADIVVTVTPAHRNPYFNMLKRDDRGQFHTVLKPRGNLVRRQDAPRMFDMTTVAYCTTPRYVLKTPALLDGSVDAVIIPPERSLDVDTEFDLTIARHLFNKAR